LYVEGCVEECTYMLYMCCGRTCHLFTSLVHRHSMYIHVHECSRRGYEIIRVHMYNHACVCAHLCDGKLAIAPDNTSSCVCIHMYVCSLLHVVQLKGGGGRFVCSVYMYMYDICEWSLYPPVAREETNIGMGSKGGSISCLCVLNRVMPNINN
jgi:hypothetical protein